MLKGVNRQIVDVPQPESAYFERAIFFVKPQYADADEGKLKATADELVKKAGGVPGSRRSVRRVKLVKILSCALSALAGAGLMLLLQTLRF